LDITNRVENEERLRLLGITDGLTKLSNRRHIIQQLEEAIEQGSEEELITVAMIDIDDFKIINDTYGHLKGDDVLILFGDVITKTVRTNDYSGRYGGEEFLLVFQQTKLSEVERLVESIQLSLKVQSKHIIEKDVTFSCGIVDAKISSDLDYVSLLSLADKKLYEAKAAGKNQYISIKKDM
jgi:diguanylate cyclase (GGDEF)-like protein